MTNTQQLASDMYDKLLDNGIDKLSPFSNLDGIINCYVENTEDGNATMYFSTHQGTIQVTVKATEREE